MDLSQTDPCYVDHEPVLRKALVRLRLWDDEASMIPDPRDSNCRACLAPDCEHDQTLQRVVHEESLLTALRHFQEIVERVVKIGGVPIHAIRIFIHLTKGCNVKACENDLDREAQFRLRVRIWSARVTV